MEFRASTRAASLRRFPVHCGMFVCRCSRVCSRGCSASNAARRTTTVCVAASRRSVDQSDCDRCWSRSAEVPRGCTATPRDCPPLSDCRSPPSGATGTSAARTGRSVAVGPRADAGGHRAGTAPHPATTTMITSGMNKSEGQREWRRLPVKSLRDE